MVAELHMMALHPLVVGHSVWASTSVCNMQLSVAHPWHEVLGNLVHATGAFLMSRALKSYHFPEGAEKMPVHEDG